jgi:hypothetical protein
MSKKGENNPFSNPHFSGEKISAVLWQVPTLSTNPRVSNKTKSSWGSFIRFQNILHQ